MDPTQELYNTFSSFQRLFIRLNKISVLGVMTFFKSTGLLKFCLDRIGHLEQSELLTPIRT
jgi:hypothetical protein